MAKWLIVEEAAEYLRCTVEELKEEINKKRVPCSIFKGRQLFNTERLDEWLLGQEVSPSINISAKKTVSKEDVATLPDCDQNKADLLIGKLIGYNNRNEIFVNSFGEQLKGDLVGSEYKELSKKTYERLSRWCWPKQRSPRNDVVQEIAREISKILYGKVIERVN
ncbi:MAG: helix-turn-helix domain-containing protein [Planctomycetota bacterium]